MWLFKAPRLNFLNKDYVFVRVQMSHTYTVFKKWNNLVLCLTILWLMVANK